MNLSQTIRKRPVCITMGSLFDGISGFPYAGAFYGIKTLWASEILPTAVSVSKRHFPDTEHLGDITKLHGGKLPPVDIITFGSPCQSWSIAGAREGFEGKSGLFMEAIRVIKEMREATNGQHPKFIVFENVPGAISSAGGRDFQKILSEIAQTDIPMPLHGKWANAGMVVCDGITIEYRIIDSQFWSVPQRRRRLYLAGSFGNGSREQILFKPESLYRYLTPGGAPWERTAAHAQGGACPAIAILNDQGGDSINIVKTGLSPTLRSETHGNLPIVSMQLNEDGGQARFDTVGINGNVAGTLDSSYYKGTGNRGGIEREVVLCRATGQGNSETLLNKCATLNCNCEQPIICLLDKKEVLPINMQIATRHKSLGDGTGFGVGENGDPAYTLQEAHCHAVAVGVHQNQEGQVTVAETAYTLSTAPNASARNAPLIAVHPNICGTLCGSGAGLSRPAGMASEPDLCVVVDTEPNNNERLFSFQGFGHYVPTEKSKTVMRNDKSSTCDLAVYCLQGNMIGRQDKNGPNGSGINEGVCFSVTATDRHCVAAIDCRNHRETPDIIGTLQSKSTGSYSLNYINPIRNGFIVRRLTPLECERLMNFPDGWTAYGHDGKPICDTARYQMLGNSIVTSCAAYVLAGIVEQLLNETEG